MPLLLYPLLKGKIQIINLAELLFIGKYPAIDELVWPVMSTKHRLLVCTMWVGKIIQHGLYYAIEWIVV